MNITEKAKAYDEALKRAKDYYTDGLSLHQPAKVIIEHIFPELKELKLIKMKEEYIPMSFPEVQSLFEKEGFDDNTYLINDEKGIKDFGPCAYFIKKEWFNKINNYDK